MKKFLTGFAVAGIVLIGFTWWVTEVRAPESVPTHVKEIRTGSTTVSVRIADTPALRERGLSGTQPLSGNDGMLFIFPVDDFHSFWMKDMLYPIDMIWLDAQKRVVHVAADAQPAGYPSEVFRPSTRARYVLEVNAGWASDHGVVIGSQFEWSD